MVLVPHPDDELLVGGGMLYALAHSDEWNVKVVYSTNGDYYKHEADIRLREALAANKILGISEENIIFLGYGNRWESGHLYHSSEICKSAAGFLRTYALPDHPEYCYMRQGEHHDYTRENLRKDIISVIQDEFPELIICVDFDSHPDHRALSLLFTEAMRYILSTYPLYRPLILKKLAYENVMRGIKDYYKVPHARTFNSDNELKSTPILKWEDRISFESPAICNRIRMTQNPLYLAACCHASQSIRYKMIGAINSDVVYWRLPTENLALMAEIEVSSGNAFYLNDLKTIDSKDINDDNCDLDAAVWIPEENDKEKSIKFKWEKAQRVSYIEFYENPNEGSNIDEVIVIFDSGKQYHFSDIKHDGSASILRFERPVLISTLEIALLRGTEGSGFSEIAIFDIVRSVNDYSLPCCLFRENKEEKRSILQKIVSRYDCLLFYSEMLIRKLCITKYVLMRHYPQIVSKKYLISIYRVYHFIHRFWLLIRMRHIG